MFILQILWDKVQQLEREIKTNSSILLNKKFIADYDNKIQVIIDDIKCTVQFSTFNDDSRENDDTGKNYMRIFR